MPRAVVLNNCPLRMGWGVLDYQRQIISKVQH